MSLSQAFLNEVRARAGLSALIGQRVKLTRAGREWKGCCPFHQEKTPSFTINDDKGFYHCFGCGAHGDAIRWLTDGEGLAFIDAVRHLAEAAGLAMPVADAAGAARAARIDGIRPALEAATAWYQRQLSGHDAARQYLAARGIGPALIERFALGWAPNNAGHVRSIDGMTAAAAAAAGLIWPPHPDHVQPEDVRQSSAAPVYGRERPEPSAFFRGRVMIPIHDRRGRICGFAGRRIDGGEPKYKNSPASELFDKGRLLFNVHRAAERLRALRSAGDGQTDNPPRLLIVEGQIDAMMLDAAGFAVVAPMGTALTEAQLAEAWQMDGQPILLFDGDAAGVRAARRACETALPMMTPAAMLRIAVLADGDDPDTLVRRDGAGAVHDVLFQAQPVDRWLFGHVCAAINREDAAAVAGAAHELSDLAGRIGDPMLRREIEAAWAARHLRELSAAGLSMRIMPATEANVVRGVATPDKSAADAASVLVTADDDGERQLRQGVEAILRLRAERRAITDDIAAARAILKALGYDMKALARLVSDLESDAAGREETEAIWAAYRRAMGITGPMTEAVLPAISGAARSRAATIAGKRQRRIAAEMDMPRLLPGGMAGAAASGAGGQEYDR